ncbi:evolutionarily conserved signaling intermediate in Toll pathway, mitochondrial [Anoplophora glabripennis]|uniref:evolutionarily conserved signaling intermediate in Toll pathway, mitochondrial n=1 Tax=Anoplophora glabripennis TaxID=217634 RepID=UPI00087514EB|nr:evolutionarily conserved signaling intermediate in Toll pathway, mitochondrial [Anoplophora glabripennis]
MFCKKLIKCTTMVYKYKKSSFRPIINYVRTVHTSLTNYEEKKEKSQKAVVHRDSFQEIENKNKNTYLEMVKIFVNRDNVYRRGHVEFIYSALKNMEEFGVHKDLEVYKALIDVLPKGKFIPTNVLQAEFMHYPKQQQCIIDLLQQMEDNGVMPDFEMEDLLLNVFGKRGYPLRRYWRMMYWMPKFKNLSPWPVPEPLPTDTFELAKYAIERISSADVNSVVKVYYSADITDSIDDTWIVSSQSKSQQRLLAEYNVEEPVFVEGSYTVWIKGNPINYFILRGKAKPIIDEELDIDDVSKIEVPKFYLKPPIAKKLKIIPLVHEQEDGIIFSLCATGTSSKDSLLSWIRHLEKDGYPNLGKVPVVFKLHSGMKEVATVDNDEQEEKKEIEEK